MTQNELYHHGVPGMRWGVRKDEKYYKTKSANAVSKMKTSKTAFGRLLNNNRAYYNDIQARRIKRLNKNEGILKTVDNMYGHGELADRQKALADFYSRKASYAKTKRGKQRSEITSYNLNQWANSNSKLHNSKSIKEYGKNYVDALLNTKVKTTVGRTTTSGQFYVDNLLTGGVTTYMKDRAYKKEHKND